jgi:beta-lactamase regulating signal transducer with metallopeptidase domain
MIAAILDHLWQSTLFTLCAGLLTLILRNNGAQIRYWVWFAASVKFLIPFSLLTAAIAHVKQPFSPVLVIAPLTVDAVEQVAQPFSFTPAAASLASAAAGHANVSAILLVLWAAGLTAVVSLWFVRWSRINAAVRSATPLPLSARLPIPARSSTSVIEPGLVGIWQPILLLPEGIAAALSVPEMDAVLAHELCHMRRRDNLTAAIHMLVEAVFWFYPVVWRLGARLIAERERACDESVLASGSEPEAYAEGILKVCRFYVQSQLDCAAGVSGADLKKRVEEIMINRRSIPISTAKKIMLATVGAAVIASPFLAGAVAVHAAAADTPLQSQDSASAPPTPGEIAQRRKEQRQPRTAVAFDPKQFDKFVGFYRLQPDAFITVTRKEDRFFARLTGQDDVQWFPESPIKFFAKVVHAQISFTTDPQGNVTELVLHQNGREQRALRVDGTVAKAFEAALQKRIAKSAPDPEREALVRRDIAAQQKGAPDLEIMSPGLIAAVKQQWPQIQQWNRQVGKFENLVFLHVSRQGWDIYDATYEHGHMIVSVGPLTPDHKLQGIFYQSS